jgi:hypothetical protein
MSRQTFPNFCDQPGLTIHNFAIDGSAVGASQGTAGLDGRGKFLCNISKSANVVTVNWQVSFGDIPYVFLQTAAGQADTLVEIVTNTDQQLVYQTFTASTHAPLNDADLYVHVDGYNTTSFVS